MELLAKRFPSLRNWWTRPCGGRAVVQLALPLVLSTASWTLMHFVDRVFLTWYSTDAIAAAMPAGMLHFTLICLPLGITSYVNTFVAQYAGSGHPERVGKVVWQGVWIGLASLPCFLVLVPLAPSIFTPAGHPAHVTQLEIAYFQSLAYGGAAAVIAGALASFFTGLGFVRVVMLVDMAAAVVNMGMDYALIFGNWGVPELGVVGAGWATSCAQWFKVAALIAVMATREFRRPYRLRESVGFDRKLLGRLLRFGGPSGLQMFTELMAFTAFIFLVGQLGPLDLAATTIAFSVNSIAFVPMLGLGIAVATIVGQQIGAGRPDLATRATWTSIWLGGLYTGGMSVLYFVLPDLFLQAHAAAAPRDFADLQLICRGLLRFVAAYCVLDMMQIVFSSAIKGAGDTRFVLVFTLAIAPLPVLLGWMGVHYWDWRLSTFWVLITTWISLMGIVYFLRFQFGPWRRMTVLEPELVDSRPTLAVFNDASPECLAP